jgi:hypothetical protein
MASGGQISGDGGDAGLQPMDRGNLANQKEQRECKDEDEFVSGAVDHESQVGRPRPVAQQVFGADVLTPA